MEVTIHRIYDQPLPSGYKVLADRLWPRGISKEEAHLDAHWAECAPSDELRKWFSHDAEKWGEFRKKYLHELSEKKDTVRSLVRESKEERIILLYGAKDTDHTHAKVLKEYIEKLQ
ncbi:DUF488 domain-containing protein [Methyloligella solikamskensis]|uniref:DUF488 domain-containing protein n=1 Tax=Methyloligella solikamskensis TaxID=1177756 RepID=A0ABW3J9L9_9HYPH